MFYCVRLIDVDRQSRRATDRSVTAAVPRWPWHFLRWTVLSSGGGGVDEDPGGDWPRFTTMQATSSAHAAQRSLAYSIRDVTELLLTTTGLRVFPGEVVVTKEEKRSDSEREREREREKSGAMK